MYSMYKLQFTAATAATTTTAAAATTATATATASTVVRSALFAHVSIRGTFLAHMYTHVSLFGSYAGLRTLFLGAARKKEDVANTSSGSGSGENAADATSSGITSATAADADASATAAATTVTTTTSSGNGSKLPIEQVLAVTAAGAGAGLFSELVGHYVKPLETWGTAGAAGAGAGTGTGAGAGAGVGAGAGAGVPNPNLYSTPRPNQSTNARNLWNGHRSLAKLPRPTIRTLLPSTVATAIGFIALEYA